MISIELEIVVTEENGVMRVGGGVTGGMFGDRKSYRDKSKKTGQKLMSS